MGKKGFGKVWLALVLAFLLCAAGGKDGKAPEENSLLGKSYHAVGDTMRPGRMLDSAGATDKHLEKTSPLSASGGGPPASPAAVGCNLPPFRFRVSMVEKNRSI